MPVSMRTMICALLETSSSSSSVSPTSRGTSLLSPAVSFSIDPPFPSNLASFASALALFLLVAARSFLTKVLLNKSVLNCSFILLANCVLVMYLCCPPSDRTFQSVMVRRRTAWQTYQSIPTARYINALLAARPKHITQPYRIFFLSGFSCRY